jgi:hypothetical protein
MSKYNIILCEKQWYESTVTGKNKKEAKEKAMNRWLDVRNRLDDKEEFMFSFSSSEIINIEKINDTDTEI